MLIAQLSDLHVCANRAPAFRVVDSATALEKTVAHLKKLPQKPDCFVITGDIAANGETGGYEIVADALSGLAAPLFVLPGNHDVRENLVASLGKYCPADAAISPYLCYTVEDFPLRLVFMDTVRPSSPSGYLDPPVAAWLEETLAARPDAPTLLFTHHPPFLSGLGWMDKPFENADVFGRILGKHPKVRLCCGHLHRAMVTVWHGVTALTAPPLAGHIEPDLSPEGGATFTVEAPGYMLHHLHERTVNSHICRVPGVWPFGGPYHF